MSLKSKNYDFIYLFIFFFLAFSIRLLYRFVFGENPTEIGQLVPKIQTVEGLNKQQETKETTGFVWLYLINSICEFLCSHKPTHFHSEPNFNKLTPQKKYTTR